MKPVLKALLLSFVLLMMTERVSAEEWRGLTPLKSTRVDVVKIFNECNDQQESCEFAIENEDITIEFAGIQNCSGVPAGTVLSIQRDLRKETTLEALGFDKRRFQSFDPSTPPKLGYRAFIDEQAGLLLKSLRGQIFQINYIATEKERSACPKYYENPRDFVEVFLPHFQVVDSVECPKIAIAGEKVPIAASYARTGQRHLLTWSSTGGRVIEGPTPRNIFLDTTGLAGKTVTVTVELNDGNQHTAGGSCTINVSAPPKN
jgi:hypothetical protein